MIKVDKLDKYFYKGKSNENHVLKEVSLELDKKGLVCILGESGSGKTTLLNTIGGLDTFRSGTITIDDTVLHKYESQKIENLRNQKFGYIFQNYYLLQDYTVAYNIKLALNVFDLTEQEKEERVDYVLDAMNMTRYKKKLVSQLSGGQQQRVSIARALVRAPEIILADEPTGNLDEENTIKIMSILKSISKDCLVIVVSHEKAIAKFFADRIIEIQDGVIQRDSINEAKGSYQRMDDSNIYLRDMDVREMESEEIDVSLFWDTEDGDPSGPDEKLRLSLAWKDGKLYIQSPDEIPLVLAGNESGRVMLDESRPKLEQSQVEEIAYDLQPVKAKKSSTLPLREIWKLACENIQMMGKKHRFMVGILLATSILLVLALADYRMQRSIDIQSVVTEDSHYVTVSLDAVESQSVSKRQEKVKEYCEKYIANGKYQDAYIETVGVMNLSYNGFRQIKGTNGRIKDFSVVSLKHLQESDLICGRMPKNRNEFVIDRWLIDRFCREGNIMGEVYQNNNALLNIKVGTIITGLQLTLVGIADTEEPSIYVNDNLAMGMSYVGNNIMSEEELAQLYPDEWGDVKLASDEVLLHQTLYDEYEHQKRWNHGNENITGKIRKMLPGTDWKAAGHFPDECGVEYVFSQENCDAIRRKAIESNRKFKVYTDNVEETIRQLKATGEEYRDYFRVNAVSLYEQQWEEYQKERQVDINAGYLVTLAVTLLSFIMVYFTIKSNAMARSEELTVYRLIGISRGSILKTYILEMLLITAYTCIPAVLVTSGIIKFISSIPSLEMNLQFPWWLAFVLLVILFVVNAVISVLPVQGILRKPPAQLAARG